MSDCETFDRLFEQCPLVAIIRGVTPDECEAVGDALYEGGIRIIEVPLNSPQPFDSIGRLAARLGERAMIGAGTVLRAEQVAEVQRAGGRLVVSPSVNAEVIAATVAAGMVSCPGYFTPSEAFAAIDAGAHALKLFPAEAASPAVVKAQRAVLPRLIKLLVFGGVSPESLDLWRAAGADGFGIGSGIYRPGQSPEQCFAGARGYTSALGGR